MCASSAMTTSKRRPVAVLIAATLPSRSQVVTHQRSPPSPNAAIDRVQCGTVIAAGRSATTSTLRTGRALPARCAATCCTPRTAVPVLPTPGSSPSRNIRPPAAACAAMAAAPVRCSARGCMG